MKFLKSPHRWDVTPKEAVQIQRELAQKVVFKKSNKKICYIAGVDMAFTKDGKKCIAAVVLWNSKTQQIVESHIALKELKFPYIPGLLSFREVPAVLSVLKKLTKTPDVLMCDGQGYAHPRRFGIACHLGVLTNLPSIGCGKSRLIGTYKEPDLKRGSQSVLKDKDEVIGTVLRTRDNVKPIFVSVGHRLDLDTAVKIVLDCGQGFRLPEPTRLADQLAGKKKRNQIT